MDEPVYLNDPRLRSLETEVIDAGEEQGRPWVRLRETIFYAESGGQPPDHGRINEARVVDVQSRGGRIYHTLDRPIRPGPVRIELDWKRRFDHMQQHTGQHLLTAVAEDRHGWVTRAFHLGEADSTIDLDAKTLPRDRLREVEDVVNAVIREARPVRARNVTREELARLTVRTRGLPDHVVESIRLVEIEGIDLNTCGGTHVRTTAELQLCHLMGTEKVRGISRLRFTFGERAVAGLRAAAAREAELKKLTGAAPDAFVEVATGWDRDRRELLKALRRTEVELAEALAERFKESDAELLVRHFPGRDAGFLRTFANHLLAAAPAKTVVLFGDDGTAAFFLVAVGALSNRDASEIGAEVQTALQGKGGGKGREYQGRGPEAGRIAAALKISTWS